MISQSRTRWPVIAEDMVGHCQRRASAALARVTPLLRVRSPISLACLVPSRGECKPISSSEFGRSVVSVVIILSPVFSAQCTLLLRQGPHPEPSATLPLHFTKISGSKYVKIRRSFRALDGSLCDDCSNHSPLRQALRLHHCDFTPM